MLCLFVCCLHKMGLRLTLHYCIPDVGVVVVGDVLHSEDLAVLLGLLVLWPEGRIGLEITISQSEFSPPGLGRTHIADSGRGIAEDDHSRAVVIVDERPEITAGAHHGPLRHDVLPGVSVALR